MHSNANECPLPRFFVRMAMLLRPAGRAEGYNYQIKSVSHFRHTLACTRAWLLSFCCLQSELRTKAVGSRDLLFIKLWAATLRMPEMERACGKHQNGQV